MLLHPCNSDGQRINEQGDKEEKDSSLIIEVYSAFLSSKFLSSKPFTLITCMHSYITHLNRCLHSWKW